MTSLKSTLVYCSNSSQVTLILSWYIETEEGTTETIFPTVE